MRYEDVILADGPVGYWPMNENSGSTAYDLGSTGVNGAYVGSPAVGVLPFPGGGHATFFNGAGSQYMQVADNAAWSPHAGTSGVMTIVVWAALTSAGTASRRLLWGKASSSNEEYDSSVGTSNDFGARGTTLAGVGSLDAYAGAQSWFPDRRWRHVVYTYDYNASSGVLWLDGKIAATNSSRQVSGDGTSALQIGSKALAGNDDWAGPIAHFAIFNKVLPSSRIRTHYRAGLGPKYQRRAFAIN